MPYIKQEYREHLQRGIDCLIPCLDMCQRTKKDSLDGCLNYAITKLLIHYFIKDGYNDLERAIGLLEMVKQEFYRRIVVEYEERKRLESGEVY